MAGQTPFDIPLNCLVLGNPGSGKKTFANLYGSLLKALGVLSDGGVVCMSSCDLIASFAGQSTTKTVKVLKEAAGKVLIL